MPIPDSWDRLLVVAREAGGLFSGVEAEDRRTVFDRCARIALRAFDPKITLNPKWMAFHDGNRVSIFATSRAERSVLVLASKEEGGLTKTLAPAVAAGFLVEVI